MSEGRTLRGKWGWLLLALLVLVADLWTKESIFGPLAEREYHWVLGEWFGFTKVWNKGMMWGALQEWSSVLRIARMAAAVVVFVMIVGTPRGARLLQTALALVLGGALGNIYDGFAYGKVRDFLLVDLDLPGFDPFPVFNVADSAICIGVGLLALGLALDARSSGDEAADGESAARDGAGE
ncbi:MAG: signal peptidase II [Planctomycetes bacterium]|nr:signal peptidase II [Planctomycetota bacterium]